LFAWLLFSLGFLIGIPAPVENSFGAEVQNPALTVVALLPNSPAEEVGLRTGDKIVNVTNKEGEMVENLEAESVSIFITESNQPVFIEVDRGAKILNFEVTPRNIEDEGKKLIGVQMDMVGTLSLPIHKAFVEGAKATYQITHLTLTGIFKLIKDAVVGKADLSSVTGPVGIVGLVGDASRLGFSYLLTFTALISINLAVVNLIPFPALDGGRLLFVAIEAITKKPVNSKFAGIANTVGFFLLIGLMLIVTYRDIVKLF
jgi:regulator of sigma E protease